MRVDESLIRKFNTVRTQNLCNSYTRDGIMSALSQIPEFTTNSRIVSILVKHNALVEVPSKGKYRKQYKFTTSPVHVSVLSQCATELKEYYYKYYDRRKGVTRSVVQVPKEVSRHPITEEYCISFLKERGYKVYKKNCRL